MPKKLSREHEIDLRFAAFHEAAHAVVAHAAGFKGMIRICLEPRTNPGPNDTLVAGNAAFDSQLSKTLAATVAWAGDMACAAQADPDILFEDLDDLDFAFEPSPSDQGWIDQVAPRLQRKVRRGAWRVVCDNWEAITTLAERHIKDYRKTRLVYEWLQATHIQTKAGK